MTRDRRRVSYIDVAGRRVKLGSLAQPDGRVEEWMGFLVFRWWSERKLQFYIFVEDSQPSSAQLQLLEELVAPNFLSRTDIEAGIFEHYQKYIPPSGPVDWQGRPLENVDCVEDLRRTISGPSITIYPSKGGASPGWSMDFGADWDDEHGVRLNFIGAECTYVGN